MPDLFGHLSVMPSLTGHPNDVMPDWIGHLKLIK